MFVSQEKRKRSEKLVLKSYESCFKLVETNMLEKLTDLIGGFGLTKGEVVRLRIRGMLSMIALVTVI